MLQDGDGQIADTWSVSAGLDYPAVGPEHAHLKDSGRAQYVGATDAEALAAFKALAENEGILCAFESAHALAHALKLAAAGARQRDPRRPVRPRRQGRRPGAGAARMSRYAAMFERLGQRGRVRRLPDARRSRSRDQRATARCRGRRRRRHGRGRHPFLRPGRRRAGDPGGRAARACRRRAGRRLLRADRRLSRSATPTCRSAS